eukprot:s1099_g18.t1
MPATCGNQFSVQNGAVSNVTRHAHACPLCRTVVWSSRILPGEFKPSKTRHLDSRVRKKEEGLGCSLASKQRLWLQPCKGHAALALGCNRPEAAGQRFKAAIQQLGLQPCKSREAAGDGFKPAIRQFRIAYGNFGPILARGPLELDFGIL